MPSARRFPPPWTIEEHNNACFIVRDKDGQALGYFYFEDESGRRSAAKFGRDGLELLGVVGAPHLECVEPAAETCELIRRQLGDGFGDLFDFHAAQYSTGGGRKPIGSELLINGDIRRPQVTVRSSVAKSPIRGKLQALAERRDKLRGSR